MKHRESNENTQEVVIEKQKLRNDERSAPSLALKAHRVERPTEVAIRQRNLKKGRAIKEQKFEATNAAPNQAGRLPLTSPSGAIVLARRNPRVLNRRHHHCTSQPSPDLRLRIHHNGHLLRFVSPLLPPQDPPNLLSPDYQTLLTTAYTTLTPLLLPLLRLLTPLRALLLPLLAPLLNLLASTTTTTPTLTSLALLLLTLYLSMRLLGLFRRLLAYGAQLVFALVFYGGLLVAGMYVWQRGVERTVGDVAVWTVQVQEVWGREYERWSEVQREARREAARRNGWR